MILTAPSVIKDKKTWKMWYVSCTKWKSKNIPKYNIKYAESRNGKVWSQSGKVCIKLNKNERAVARPSVLKIKNKFYMWYCKENKVGNYTLGYAISNNGKKWIRSDKKIGLYKSKIGWDSKMITYPNVIFYNKKYYMFFNGNNYGQNGFGLAVSENINEISN